MKKQFILTESDIKSVMAEKFKVEPNDVEILADVFIANGQEEQKVTIIIESEVQNYDL